MRFLVAGTEAVFSVLGFECGLPRASGGPSDLPKHELAKHGLGRFAERAAATLFSPFFPPTAVSVVPHF